MSERLVYYAFEKDVRIDAPMMRGVTIASCPTEKVAEAIAECLDAAALEGQDYSADAWKEKLQ